MMRANDFRWTTRTPHRLVCGTVPRSAWAAVPASTLARVWEAAAYHAVCVSPDVALSRGKAWVRLTPASAVVICGLTCVGCCDDARESVIGSVIGGQRTGLGW